MPDTFQPERRSGDPSTTLRAGPSASLGAGAIRLHVAPPSLTAHDREILREIRRRYLSAVVHLDDAIEANRLDIALDALLRMSTDTNGQAVAAATALGRR